MHVIVWTFRPRPGREREFERAYGPGGDWAGLFRQAPGYLGTDLLQATDGSGRYLTVDRWQSRTAYEAFRTNRQAEYEAVDRACGMMTVSEECVGEFAEIEASSTPTPKPTGPA